MIDSHCHLDHEPMFSDLKNVVIRSKENGVKKFYPFVLQMIVLKKLLKLLNLIQLYMELLVYILMKLILTRSQKMKLLKMLVLMKKLLL